MFTLSTRAKEAIKTGLAMVLAYGIAMGMGWPNPYWAAFAVAMISLPTAGQSLFKGALRMGGTFVGCAAGVAILALALQDRWVFLLLVSGWIFVVTYFMIGSQRAYFWHVSGFVCLIITLSGTSGSENPFLDAMARTVDTAMGILVYTLVTIFIWPRTNVGAAKRAALSLLATQTQLLRFCEARLTAADVSEDSRALRGQQIEQLGKLNQALQAEGAERYAVHALRHQWDQLATLSSSLMVTIDRWTVGFAELSHLDVRRVLPNFEAYMAELVRRLDAVRGMLEDEAPGLPPRAIDLALDSTQRQGLSHFDRAALAVAWQEMQTIEAVTRSLHACVLNLSGGATQIGRPQPFTPAGPKRGIFSLPVPDLDRLWGATYAATTVIAGFLIWIFFDPPGHASMYEFPGIIAMTVAATPQLKATAFLKPFAVAMILGLAVYVLVLPRLTSFGELAVPIFLFTFATCYFFTGLGRIAGLVALINMVSIQNEQTYDFARMANSYIFTLMGFLLVFVVSYLLGSPRPEKVFQHQTRRFFRSAAALMAHAPAVTGGPTTLRTPWRTAFHLQALRSFPGKLAAWSKAIDRRKYPGNPPEQVQDLVNRLQVLVYRLEAFLEAGALKHPAPFAQVMHEEINHWRENIHAAFKQWANEPGAAPVADLHDRFATWLAGLEARIDACVVGGGEQAGNEADASNFYRMLGSYRGVTDAALAHAGVAAKLDWKQWREECF